MNVRKKATAVVAVAAAVSASAVSAASAAPAAATGWRNIASTRTDGVLSSIVAFGRKDAWAVGGEYADKRYGGVIARWNGKKWTRSSAPAYVYEGTAVAGTSGKDVWMAAVCVAKQGRQYACALHWDGKKWKNFPLPGLAATSRANALAAVSTKDVWIAGSSGPSTYFAHWNGKAWSHKSSPRPGTNTSQQIGSIAVAGPKDIWAVGLVNDNNLHPLIQHWNGTKWTTDTKVPAIANFSSLRTVVVLPNRQVWAAGHEAAERPLVLRRGKTGWVRGATIPQTSPTAVTALSKDGGGGLWAGLDDTTHQPTPQPTPTRYAHWNGKAWTIVHGTTASKHRPPTAVGLTLVPGTRSLWSTGAYIDDRNGLHRGFVELTGPLPH